MIILVFISYNGDMAENVKVWTDSAYQCANNEDSAYNCFCVIMGGGASDGIIT